MFSLRKVFSLTVMAAVFAVFLQPADAQRSSGEISVRVADPVAAAVVNASVTAIDAHGVESKAKNNNDGT